MILVLVNECFVKLKSEFWSWLCLKYVLFVPFLHSKLWSDHVCVCVPSRYPPAPADAVESVSHFGSGDPRQRGVQQNCGAARRADWHWWVCAHSDCPPHAHYMWKTFHSEFTWDGHQKVSTRGGVCIHRNLLIESAYTYIVDLLWGFSCERVLNVDFEHLNNRMRQIHLLDFWTESILCGVWQLRLGHVNLSSNSQICKRHQSVFKFNNFIEKTCLLLVSRYLVEIKTQLFSWSSSFLQVSNTPF